MCVVLHLSVHVRASLTFSRSLMWFSCIFVSWGGTWDSAVTLGLYVATLGGFVCLCYVHGFLIVLAVRPQLAAMYLALGR